MCPFDYFTPCPKTKYGRSYKVSSLTDNVKINQVKRSRLGKSSVASFNLMWERSGSVAECLTRVLDHLDWESLEARRAKTQLTMLFKIIHGLVDIPAEDYLVPASTRTRSQHSLKFLQIPVSSNCYKFSFFPRTICRWNSLPANAAEAPSLVSFKRELLSLSI